MNKIIITLALILTVTLSFADGRDKDALVKPTSELLNNTKSFNVGGLKACTGEADDEDAIGEFILEDSTKETTALIPLTEDAEESVVVVYAL